MYTGGPLNVSHHHNEHHLVTGRSLPTPCRNAMHVQTGGVSRIKAHLSESGRGTGQKVLAVGVHVVHRQFFTKTDGYTSKDFG